MELVRLPALLPLLALFSSEESRIGVVKRLLEKLTTVVDLVEDKVTIGTTCTHYNGPLTNLKSISHLFFCCKICLGLFIFFSSIIFIRCPWEPCQDFGWVCICSDQPGAKNIHNFCKNCAADLKHFLGRQKYIPTDQKKFFWIKNQK